MAEMAQTRAQATGDHYLWAYVQLMAQTAQSEPARHWFGLFAEQERRLLEVRHQDVEASGGAMKKSTGRKGKRMNSYSSEGWSAIMVLVALVNMAITARAQESGKTPAADGGAPAFTLPALPYAQDALEPHLSARTISFHYGKHHQAYVDNLNKLAVGAKMADLPLDEIIRQTVGKTDQAGLFNNAAQVWNHTFFWNSMKPNGGGVPTGRLAEMITAAFGSFDAFKAAFSEAAMTQFGSGWAWLIQEGDTLKIVKTSDADTPIAHGQTALLTCDVWEHAYYLDYQNRRKDFVQAFLDHLANWDYAASQLK